MYHNDGHGHFTEVAAKIGLDRPGKGLGVSIGDFDGDGKVDVAIANDSMVEYLYRNKGNGTFEELGMPAEIAVDGDGRTYAGMGIDLQDFDNDGLPDLIITNLANQKYALYRNNGDGSFSYDSYVTGIGGMTLLHSGWGIKFLDYDNDGRKDLLIAQGHDLDTVELNYPQLHYKEPPLLAYNTGKGFVDVSSESGDVFKERWVGRGLAIGDIDNDGRIDAVFTTNGGPAYVLRNETKTDNHWLTLLLVGHKSNRDGIGAVIKLTTPAGSQWVTVTTGGSYLSASDKRAHFGLGTASVAQSIQIRWPSGIRADAEQYSRRPDPHRQRTGDAGLKAMIIQSDREPSLCLDRARSEELQVLAPHFYCIAHLLTLAAQKPPLRSQQSRARRWRKNTSAPMRRGSSTTFHFSRSTTPRFNKSISIAGSCCVRTYARSAPRAQPSSNFSTTFRGRASLIRISTTPHHFTSWKLAGCEIPRSSMT